MSWTHLHHVEEPITVPAELGEGQAVHELSRTFAVLAVRGLPPPCHVFLWETTVVRFFSSLEVVEEVSVPQRSFVSLTALSLVEEDALTEVGGKLTSYHVRSRELSQKNNLY